MTEIRKYPNRRLYDTARSRYVNLDELAAMIRGGEDVRIVDAESGADLTREVLLQVVLDVLKATEFFPTGMLRRIIRASGDDPVNRLLRQQITAGLELLSAQMDQVETLFRTSPPPRPTPAPSAAPPPEEKEPAADKELDALRKKLEELEKRLGR
jgi:polyhydroxyalkanoate synthesis repressor PhaR